LVGESVLKQAQFVHFLLNSSAIDIAKRQIFAALHQGWVHAATSLSFVVDGFGKTSVCLGFQRPKPNLVVLIWIFAVYFVELGSFFLFDSLVQWRQVAACDWSEKTWTPGWMKNFG